MRKSKLQLPLIPTFLVCVLLLLNSCTKENNEQAEIDLIDPQLKKLVVKTGFSDTVTIKSKTWSIAYVKDGMSGEPLKDANGIPIQLDDIGTVQLAEKWLELEKTNNNKLNITLLENFTDEPRNFVIGIQSENDERQEMRFVQSRGEGYELIEKEIVEIEGSRKIYTSSEGCSTVTLVNNSDLEKKMETSVVFKGVKYSSEFSSDDYGAFDWIGKEDSLIFMDELMRDGYIVWADQVPYQKGIAFEDFMKPNGSKEELTLRPNSVVVVSGEMEYLERSAEFTFTIKNKTSGNRFKIKGIWSQKVPLTSHTLLNL